MSTALRHGIIRVLPQNLLNVPHTCWPHTNKSARADPDRDVAKA